MSERSYPAIDRRGYDDIIRQIKELAPFYTPDWRFHEEHPDMGTALARMFALLLAGSVDRLNQTPQNHKTAFYNVRGACRRPARPASGAVCFKLSSPDAEGSTLPRDFKLYGPVINDDGTRYCYETQRELFVSPARLTHVLYIDGQSDTMKLQEASQLPFHTETEPNLQSHRLTLYSELLRRAHDESRLFLSIHGQGGGMWRGLMSNPEAIKWSVDERELTCIDTEQGPCLCGLLETEYVTMEARGDETLELPSPEGISMSLEANDIPPDAIYAKDERRGPETRFAIFGNSYGRYDTAYILCDSVLRQTGAHVSLSFTVDFTEELLGEMPQQMLPKKLFVPKTKYPKPERRDIFIAETAWEYWNGAGFMPLTLLSPASDVFRGIDRFGDIPGAQEHTISFVCPEIIPLLTGAEEGLYIRARIVYVSGEYERPARMLVPNISLLRFSYSYPKPLPVRRFISENNASSSELSALPPYLFTRPPDEASLCLIFDRPPANGFIGLLFVIDGDEGDANVPTWSVFSEYGWKEFHAEDWTDGLTRTGIVSFRLPVSPVYIEQYGRAGYWIRASFPGARSFRIRDILMNAAPVLQCESTECYVSDRELKYIKLPHVNIVDERIYVNHGGDGGAENEKWELCLKDSGPFRYSVDSVHGRIEFAERLRLSAAGRTVRVCYRHGGGIEANLDAGAEFTPSLSMGYVQSAVNPLPISGGARQEAQDAAQQRAAGELRHGGRAVTAEDYEDLVREDDMALVKCVSAAGAVTLVILMTDYKAPFNHVKERILSKLKPVLPLGIGKITVRAPELVYVSVTAVLGIISDAYDDGEAEAALQALLDPIAYSAENGVGKLPDSAEIRGALLSLPHIRSCRRLFVRYRGAGGETDETPPFALPICGELSISFTED